MNRSNQYKDDNTRLSELLERFTGIDKDRANRFLKEYSVSKLQPFSSIICKTEAQKNKLSMLFEFKNLYETIKAAENNRQYTLRNTLDAKNYFINYFTGLDDRERFVAAFLDAKNNVINTKILFTGTVNEAPIFPREIIKESFQHASTAVVIAHNHPGGTLKASESDIAATNRILKAFDAVDMHLVDHIIVAGDQAISLADSGYLLFGNFMSNISKTASSVSKENDGYNKKAKKPSILKQLATIQNQQDNERAASKRSNDIGKRSRSRE
jgi:DNA repair protein RadC